MKLFLKLSDRQIKNLQSEDHDDFMKYREVFEYARDKRESWLVREMTSDNKHIKDMVKSQQRTIEALTNALCDKYSHGLFIYSEDGKVPMVIRNGKELTNDMTTEFSISWCPGEIPSIQIEQVAATSRDDEE